nr:unnamed protein product [Digitaria exilis]
MNSSRPRAGIELACACVLHSHLPLAAAATAPCGCPRRREQGVAGAAPPRPPPASSSRPDSSRSQQQLGQLGGEAAAWAVGRGPSATNRAPPPSIRPPPSSRWLGGMRNPASARGGGGLLTPEQFLEERESMLQALFLSCTKLPGVLRLIHHLHSNGIPIAVATGSHKRHFALKTQNHQEMFSLMHHVVMGDDPEVKAGKPSPDIFLAAMRRFEGNVEPILSSLLDFNPSEWGLPVTTF